MKYLSIVILSLFMFTACTGQTNTEVKEVESSEESTNSYGDNLSEATLVSFSSVKEKLASEEKVNVKVSGEVASVCQMSGCWIKVKTESGEEVMVTFKDYGFTVPKDCAGKTVVIEGDAFYKEMSAADQKHYAEDEGKSKEEIDQIKAPKRELSLVASGVKFQ